MTLAALLIDLREREGLSRAELAARSGVSASQLSRLETGTTRQPHVLTLSTLARALNREHALSAITYIAADLGDHVEELYGVDVDHPIEDLLGRVDEVDEPTRHAAYRTWAWVQATEGTDPEAGDEDYAAYLRRMPELRVVLPALTSLSAWRRAKVIEYVHEQQTLQLHEPRDQAADDAQAAAVAKALEALRESER